MKNAIITNNAIPPATDSPMMDPVPSPEFSSPFGGEVDVGVGLLLEVKTVTMTTVGEPSDPVLWTLLTTGDGGGGVFVGVGVEVGVRGVEVGED